MHVFSSSSSSSSSSCLFQQVRACVYERLSDREIGIEQNREIDSERVSERPTFFYNSVSIYLSFTRGATISYPSVPTYL